MSFRSNENLNRMGSVAGKALSELDSYPVKELNGVGLDISNNDGSTILLFTISGRTTEGSFIKSYRVPAGGVLNELFPPFSELNVTQVTTSFDIIIKEAV